MSIISSAPTLSAEQNIAGQGSGEAWQPISAVTHGQGPSAEADAQRTAVPTDHSALLVLTRPQRMRTAVPATVHCRAGRTLAKAQGRTGDGAQARVVPLARVGGAAADDEFGAVVQRLLLELVVVDVTRLRWVK